MSSKNISEKKSETKYTRCDSCRQDILSEKMFLHEGFCHRNNIFCDHCEKVYLKKDYEEHLKDLRNSINSAKSTEIDEKEEIPVIPIVNHTFTTTTVVNPNTYYEFIEMPWTEEIKVNKPIVISESGNILSSQNKNEYLLPFFGIQANDNQYGFNYRNNYPMKKINKSVNIYDNYNIYRNGINNDMNFVNNNINYHINNYQYNNISRSEIKTITSSKNSKLERRPEDRSSESFYNCLKKLHKSI